MAMRKIDAPGIEVNEIDKSQYGYMPDYSIVGTTALICGFADKGENYKINWINSKATLIDTYGYPTNEFEQYFYNANLEVLNKGGILLAAKLPYNNDTINKYSFCEYDIVGNSNQQPISISQNSCLSSILSIDNSISSYLEIRNSTNATNGLMSIEDFDNLKIQKTKLNNKIRIVDISRTKYDNINVADSNNITSQVECLGIMPVIVTPTNALFYQGLISTETNLVIDDKYNATVDFIKQTTGTQNLENSIQIEKTTDIENYTPVCDFTTKDKQYGLGFDSMNFNINLSATSLYDNSVSKIATQYFPYLNNNTTSHIDRQYLKQIGVVVFNVYKDSAANNNKINFEVLESFVGSLDKNARDESTKKSIFIDDIINSSSKYINFFSGCNTNAKLYTESIIIHTANQIAKSLGYYSSQSKKIISYKESILDALNIIFDNGKDKNLYNIDIVVDAGVSNIAIVSTSGEQTEMQSLTNITLNDSSKGKWINILTKYDNFAKNIRKDCIFLADGHRGFCLEGNEKIVRYSKPTSTVEKDILPKLKYMIALNSSYSAGYCDWFKIYDDYTQDQIWCPPSIKALGIYLYTDTYYNIWDAPAGINRGKIQNIIDCAFTPTIDEAGKIYSMQWNYAVNYPIHGIVLEGQKTFQSRKTAFDRINVRRLFLTMEKRIGQIAKYYVYEGNTEYLRQKFVDNIRPILEDAKEKNGILEYYIKCDNTNNTPQTIDNNELHCSIAIKPVKTIEFIVLNFVCTNQTSNVTEVLR